MRRIGEEAPLAVARPLERGEHPVQRLGEPPDLVDRLRLRQPAARVPAALDLGRGGRQPPERRQRAPHQQRERRSPRAAAATNAARQHDQVHAAERRVELVRRCGDGHRATGGRAAGVGERRDVEPQLVRAEVGARVPARPLAITLRASAATGRTRPPSAERPRDDPPAAVDHLAR